MEMELRTASRVLWAPKKSSQERNSNQIKLKVKRTFSKKDYAILMRNLQSENITEIGGGELKLLYFEVIIMNLVQTAIEVISFSQHWFWFRWMEC